MPNPRRSANGSRSPSADIASKNLLDSRRLYYFFHVARLGSLTAAESVLDIAQSAISRQIQQLESEVGDRLLLRTGRGVTLTPAGEVLFEQAETILRGMAETVDKLERIRHEPAGGQVSIAAPPTFANLYMPEAVRRFTEAFPHVRLVAHEASSGQVYEYLVSGQVDMAIVLQVPTSQRVTLRKLITEPLYLMAGAGHRLAARPSMERRKLADIELTMPITAHGSRALLEAYCAAGNVHLNPRMHLDSLAMTKAVVREGRVCAVLPLLACSPEIERGDIVAIPLVPALRRTVYLASLRDRPQTAAMKALARDIADVVRAKINEPALPADIAREPRR